MKDTAFNLTVDFAKAGVVRTLTGNGKFTQLPVRSEVILTSTISGTTITVDDITAGGYDYIKTTPYYLTKYTQTPAGNNSTLGVGGGSINNIEKLNDPTLMGTETVDGYQTYHLRGTLAAPTPEANTSTPSIPFTEELWVKTLDFYPVKAVLTATSTADGQSPTVVITVIFLLWNAGLTVNVPPPSEIENG